MIRRVFVVVGVPCVALLSIAGFWTLYRQWPAAVRRAPIDVMRPPGLGGLGAPRLRNDSSQTDWLGVRRTNSELMASRGASARTTRAPHAVDVPLDPFAATLLHTASAATGTGGLRVDLSFVAAIGQGPPDTQGAAGPTQYLVVLNSVVQSFNKATGAQDGVLDLELGSFFSPTEGGQFASSINPKVRFDRLSGRWFIAAFSFPSNILLAVSDGGVLTPGSDWTFFSFLPDQVPPVGEVGCLPDYTRMAVDAYAVYLVFDMWLPGYTATCHSNAPTATAFVIRKTSVLGSGPLVATAFRSKGYFLVPVDQFEAGSGIGYITTQLRSTNSGSYHRIIDPGGTPTLSAEIVYSGVANTRAAGSYRPVRHKGNPLESGVPSDYSGRLAAPNQTSHSVPLRSGRLWVGDLWGVDNTGTLPVPNGTDAATRNGLSFMEIRDVDGATPSVVQWGLLFTPSAANDFDQRNYWIPSLMVNGQGHLVLAGSAAGTSEYVNAALAGRLATDPPGTLRTPILYTNATAAFSYGAVAGTPQRWGDYSNVSLDPCDDMTMWAIQQFTYSTSRWGVAVARIRAPAPPVLATVSPAVLPYGAASTDVTITGAPVDGEGFYDPGSGFACRLAASIDGGVVVNSVTYSSPTSITLNVSTIGATQGSRRITITNPDGQTTADSSHLSVATRNPDLDRHELHFGAVNAGGALTSVTSAQAVRIRATAAGPLTWTTSANVPWIQVAPTAGSGSGLVTIAIAAAPGLPTSGTVEGAVTVTASGSSTLVQSVRVVLHLYPFGNTTGPFGAFDTPLDNTTDVTGSIPVTGWALDEIEVRRIRILRDPVAGEPPGVPIFIGDAVLVDGSRPDVQGLFPVSPRGSRAGWGYLMLTNFLPNQGNGTFKLRAYADDADGHTTLLGSKTITCSNSLVTRPFGAIDTPAQGETVSGASYNNFGWVLARGPTLAYPPFGTVRVVIDGVFGASPNLWTDRSDLTALFPQATYPGVMNALGVSSFDTTTLANGVHTIAWVVTGDDGQTDGVGSRYFTVANSSTGLRGVPESSVELVSAAVGSPAFKDSPEVDVLSSVNAAPIDRRAIAGRRGWEMGPPRVFSPDASGRINVQGEELDRIQLHVGGDRVLRFDMTGYQRVGAELRPLPIGSHLDSATGDFTWQPGVGFVHGYDLVFVRWVDRRAVARREVRIVLNPKGSNLTGAQVVIDAPRSQQDVEQPFVLAGWAIDVDAPVETGIDAVHVWAYPLSGEGPIFLGAAEYGSMRQDVRAIFGERFGTSAYGLRVNGLKPGTYDLAVFAWTVAQGRFAPAKVVRVTIR